MSAYYKCDNCEDLITPTNMAPKILDIPAKSELTDVDFSIEVRYGTNALGQNIVRGQGDLCMGCLVGFLHDYVLTCQQAEDEALHEDPDECEDEEEETISEDDFAGEDEEEELDPLETHE